MPRCNAQDLLNIPIELPDGIGLTAVEARQGAWESYLGTSGAYSAQGIRDSATYDYANIVNERSHELEHGSLWRTLRFRAAQLTEHLATTVSAMFTN